jgi:TatD DNase family protein
MEMYADYLDSALDNLEKNRIIAMSMSNGIPSYERTLAAAEKSKLVIPAFGLNPHNAPDVIDRLETIREYANKSIVLGEIGLDHFFAKDPETYPLQDKLFQVFLEVAKERNAILSIHSRGADKEVSEMLDSYSISRAVIHGYDQGPELAKELTDKDIFLSFGGLITRKYKEMVPQWKAIRAAARDVPDDLFLVETDTPGAWPEEMPSERLFTVIDTLSKLRGVSSRDLQEQLNRNFLKLTDGLSELERQRKFVEDNVG